MLLSLEFELPLYSFFLLLMLSITYYKKPKIYLLENKFFEIMLITALIETAVDSYIHLICAFTPFEIIETNYYTFLNILNKVTSTSFFMVALSLFMYMLIISYNKVKNFKNLKNIFISLSLAFFLGSLFFNIELISAGTVTNATGPLIYYTYIAIGILLSASLGVALRNIKKYDKRYSVVFYMIPLLGILQMFSLIFPGIIIYDVILVFLCYIMFFTIENPDLKMINELNLAKDQAEKANAAKTEFLSNMSHEIRTPLNAIMGFSQSIVEQEIPDEIREDVNYIQMAANNLLGLVNGILDISKIETDKLEIINSDYSFDKLITEVTTLVKTKIESKNIDFRINIDKTIPNILYGDHARLKQIMINILTNAIKYTNEGFVELKISSVRKNNICRLIIAVEDSGIGIKNDQIDKLFDKFERIGVEKYNSVEGSGLGLAITKKLVELMHGKIIVQSEYGTGSKFTVAIDQKVVQKPRVDLEKTSALNLMELKANDKRVLIVDDNMINLKVIAKLLTKYDLDITETSSGKEALEKLDAGEVYDLIFLDDMMPYMSGVEAFKEMQKRVNFNTPVVMLTANAITGMKEKYLKEGFAAYIAKPVDRAELNKIVNKFLVKKKTKKAKDHGLLINEGINIDKGIRLLGNIETYDEILDKFLSEINKKIVQLTHFKEKQDMENYAILAHSLKSDAKYLGFDNLADIAFKHEQESKMENVDYVEKNFMPMKMEVERIICVIKEYLDK